MFKGFLIGLIAGVLLLAGGVYCYFASGMAPAAVGDPPMPFEKSLARKALGAHIDKQSAAQPAVPADEQNLLAGAQVYMQNCAGCHGLPGQPPPPFANRMYPPAPLLFKGKGVTDDPPSESYWKVANGIRLTGMPSFKSYLTDTQLWQVSQLVAHADGIPDSAKKVLVPWTPPAAQSPEPAPAKAPPTKQN
jgi:mono/diheme cytochrome c family protein